MSSEWYQLASTIIKIVTRGDTFDQQWDQAGPGGWQGVPTHQPIFERKKKRNANANTQMRKIKKGETHNMRRFLQNSEGSTARRLPMLYENK